MLSKLCSAWSHLPPRRGAHQLPASCQPAAQLEPRILLSGLAPGDELIQTSGQSPGQSFPDSLRVTSLQGKKGDGVFFAGDFGGFAVTIKCKKNGTVTIKPDSPGVKGKVIGGLTVDDNGVKRIQYAGSIRGDGTTFDVMGGMTGGQLP